MHHNNFTAALHHQISGNGRIKAAGKQRHNLLPRVCRKTACARNIIGRDISRFIGNFNFNYKVRVLHAHLAPGKKLKHVGADKSINLHRRKRNLLVMSAGVNLKGIKLSLSGHLTANVFYLFNLARDPFCKRKISDTGNTLKRAPGGRN